MPAAATAVDCLHVLPLKSAAETVSRMRNRRTPQAMNGAIYVVVVAAFVSRAVGMHVLAPSCGICPQGNESGAAGDFPDAALVVPTYPVGNAALTYAALSVAGTTGQDDEREFLVSLGLVSQKGNQVTPQTLSTLCFDACAAVRTMRQASFKPLSRLAPPRTTTRSPCMPASKATQAQAISGL